MSNFNKVYKNLILQQYQFTPAQTKQKSTQDKAKQQTKSTTDSSGFSSVLNNILPILLGLSSISLLFGKGIFGIGRNNNVMGGWIGQSIGGLGLLTLLPSLWSNKDLGDRLSGTFKNFANKDIWGAIKQFFGISSSADKVLKDGQKQISQLNQSQQQLQKRKQIYIENNKSFEQVRQWLDSTNHKVGYNLQLTQNICCFETSLVDEAEKKAISDVNGKKAICVLIKSQKGLQAFICNSTDLIQYINRKYISALRIAFTAAKENDLSTNPYRKSDYNTGLNILNNIQNTNLNNSEWLNNLLELIKIINSVGKSNISLLTKLFNQVSLISTTGYQLDIPSSLALIQQQTQTNTDEIAATFAADKSLKDLKDDPILNKFDKGIEQYDNQIKDQYVQLIFKSINQANNNDPTAFIIQCLSGNKILYYARNPQKNYLTDKFEQTVYFSKDIVQKLDAPGNLVEKLQKTLQKIHLPQIMKTKNPGLKVEIKSINIEYIKRVSQVLQKKFKIKF